MAITPNGYADGITQTTLKDGQVREFFVKPEERQFKMKEFIENLENPKLTNLMCHTFHFSK